MTRILYIAGFGRSGSSILGNVLAEAQGVVHGGEARNVWDDGMLRDRRCGCGERFSQCRFWADVVDHMTERLGKPEPEPIVSFRNQVARTRNAHRWVVPGTSLHRDVAALAPWLSALYDSIAKVGHSDVVIDSTMSPVYGRVLGAVPELELSVLHLVRDPRAVINAWMREGLQDREDGVRMRKYGMGSSTAKWMAENELTESLLSRKYPYLRVRYEEWAEDPKAVVGSILRFSGVEPQRWPRFINGSRVEIGIHHTVWGNPSRFVTGATEIRDDQRWRSELSPLRQKTIEIITYPLRRRYGMVPETGTSRTEQRQDRHR